MNRINEKLWPAMEPPPGFTDALVVRLLATDLAKTTRPRRIHSLAKILLAALVVSGAAFGIGAGVEKVGGSGAGHAAPFAKTSSIAMQQRMAQITVPRHPSVIVSAKERTPLKPVQAVASAAAPAAVPSASSAPPRVPACQCQRGFADMICDCY